MGHDVVPLARRRARRLGGPQARGGDRSRLPPPPAPGSRPRGWCGSTASRCRASTRAAPLCRCPQLTTGPFTRVRRGRVEPGDARRVPAVVAGFAGDRGRATAVPAGARRPGRARRRRVRPAARRRGAVRRDAGACHVGDPRRARLLRTLAVGVRRARHGRRAAALRPLHAPALRSSARRCLRGSSSMRVVGVGHAHIDSAWLWPIRETVRKCARTFASAVRLMDDRPEYRFTCSQAAQYDWMRAAATRQLFERIRDQGRRPVSGVPVGGMWVEADMNLPSGESLVRQLVHGQRWFERALRDALPRGVDPRRVRIPGRRCRRSSPPAGATASSPRSSAGTSRTGSRTTRSGGRDSTARGCSPTSRRSTPTTPRSPASEMRLQRAATSRTTAGATGR